MMMVVVMVTALIRDAIITRIIIISVMSSNQGCILVIINITECCMSDVLFYPTTCVKYPTAQEIHSAETESNT